MVDAQSDVECTLEIRPVWMMEIGQFDVGRFDYALFDWYFTQLGGSLLLRKSSTTDLKSQLTIGLKTEDLLQALLFRKYALWTLKSRLCIGAVGTSLGQKLFLRQASHSDIQQLLILRQEMYSALDGEFEMVYLPKMIHVNIEKSTVEVRIT